MQLLCVLLLAWARARAPVAITDGPMADRSRPAALEKVGVSQVSMHHAEKADGGATGVVIPNVNANHRVDYALTTVGSSSQQHLPRHARGRVRSHGTNVTNRMPAGVTAMSARNCSMVPRSFHGVCGTNKTTDVPLRPSSAECVPYDRTVASLAMCALRCVACGGCRFATFSQAARDCSLYETCDIRQMRRALDYRTLDTAGVVASVFERSPWATPHAPSKPQKEGGKAHTVLTCNRNASVGSAPEAIVAALGIDAAQLHDTPGLQEWHDQCNEPQIRWLAAHNTSIAELAQRLPPWRREPSTRSAIAAALFSRVTSCFGLSTIAEHMLAQPHLCGHLSRGAGRYKQARFTQPAVMRAATASLLLSYEFLRIVPPFPSLSALYRVEDAGDGWGLWFEESSRCLSPGEAAPAAFPYDLRHCKSRLLVPGQVLTLTVMQTFSAHISIWNWWNPQRLRWKVLPPCGNEFVQGAMPIKPDINDWAWGEWDGYPPGSYAAESYSPKMVDSEAMLLPGSQLEVEEITQDHYGTTVYARQRPCVRVRPEAAAARVHCVPSTRVVVTGRRHAHAA